MSDPIDLAAVIAQVESGGSAQRLRFEARLYEQWTTQPGRGQGLLEAISRIHACSHLTAMMIACTSWGKYQILGENLYDECACAKNVFAFCGDDFEQKFCFQTFLVKRNVNFTLDEIEADADKRAKFIAAYNGPGNPTAYWDNMQTAIKELTTS